MGGHCCSYHVRSEGSGSSCSRVRAVLEVGVVTRRRGGKGCRSGIRRKSGARGRSPKFIGPGAGDDAGAVSRARVESQGSRRLVQVTLRIRHGQAQTYTQETDCPGAAAAGGGGAARAGAPGQRGRAGGAAPRTWPRLGSLRSRAPRPLGAFPPPSDPGAFFPPRCCFLLPERSCQDAKLETEAADALYAARRGSSFAGCCQWKEWQALARPPQPSPTSGRAERCASPRLSSSQAQVRRLLDGNRSRAPCHQLQLSSCAKYRAEPAPLPLDL